MSTKVVDARVVASFVSQECQGNSHLVVIVSAKQSFDFGIVLSLEVKPLIVVMLHIDSITTMRAFHFGREVMRCGSGSMAAAHLLSERMPEKEVFTLHTIAGRVQVGKQGKNFYYQTPALGYRPAKVLSTWRGMIDRPLVDAQLIGEKNDYCLLVLKNEKDVERCKLNVARLMRISQRALIVSGPSCRTKIDYVIRYFNPRGGQYEDAATGSANAMIAPFWQEKIGKKTIKGCQLSPQGGMFLIKKRGSLQRVCGETSELPENTGRGTLKIRDVITRIENNELGFN